jgi:hypothetical protein
MVDGLNLTTPSQLYMTLSIKTSKVLLRSQKTLEDWLYHEPCVVAANLRGEFVIPSV